MIIDEIKKLSLSSINKKKKDFPLDLLGRSLSINPFSPRDLKSYLLSSNKDEAFNIIGEIKGTYNEDLDPLKIAQKYSSYGISAISVLTESNYSKCEVEYLSQIRRYVSIPLIREDFIIDKYQIIESLVYGADAICLNARLLNKKELKELYEYTLHLGLEAIIQVYNKEDLKKTIKCGVNIIAIYDKDLETSKVDNTIFEDLISMIPNDKIILVKSYNMTFNELQKLKKEGIDAFFIDDISKKENKQNIL